VAFAIDRKYPESDHAPVVATFDFERTEQPPRALDKPRARWPVFFVGPKTLRALIDEAHREAKQAIGELRDLTRGIHPPVLTDRGLDAALSALAARSAVPVTVTVDVNTRPTPTIEAIAYFVVAEALTNVARHARASRATVTVRQHARVLRIDVTDDGVGGADPARGTGLEGLVGRVCAVDGRMTVDSPAGGPTVLTVELPCAS